MALEWWHFLSGWGWEVLQRLTVSSGVEVVVAVVFGVEAWQVLKVQIEVL
jgi:hypothetical protein